MARPSKEKADSPEKAAYPAPRPVKVVSTGELLYQHRYGLLHTEPLQPIDVELICFRDNRPSEKGGLGQFGHFKQAAKLLWPNLRWHAWLEDQISSLVTEDYAIRRGDTIVRFINWSGCGAGGKAQPLGVTVWTPLGPKRMGDICLGDAVCTPEGGIAAVTGVYPQGERDVYRLTFRDDTSVDCCLEHLWEIVDRDRIKIVNTEFILRNFNRKGRFELAVPFVKPLVFHKRNLQIHPYLMGALLGNGCFGGSKGRAGLTFSSNDPPVIERVRELISPNCRLLARKNPFDYGVSRYPSKKINPIIDGLRNYGLWGKRSSQKFVPSDYLYSEIQDRWDLLQGLMDTDGTATQKGTGSFTTGSIALAEAVQTLVRSLGGTCKITRKSPSFTYRGEKREGALSFNCHITIKDSRNLFWLPRKRQKAKTRRFGGTSKIIVNVVKINHAPVQCIRVDSPKHLYVTDGFTATHNTFAAGLFTAVWWMADPTNSTAVLTSTSKEMVGRRVWPVIQQLWDDSQFRWGPSCHRIDSRRIVQSAPGDDKHSISAMAVAQGETNKAVEKLKGMHAPRVLLVVDEATGTPEAIFNVISNIRKACKDLTVLTIANAVSKLDAHGRCCEPRDGWASVSVDTEWWPTKGVEEWDIEPGLCCHYDGFKSPNVKAGRTLYDFIYTHENYQRDVAKGMNTIEVWSQSRGFWAPEGTTNTVLSETMVTKYDLFGKFAFVSQATPIAFADTAFGGDECKFQFGLLGDLPTGKLGIQLTESLVFRPLAAFKDETDYQVAHAFITECKKRQVRPEYAGMDATGTGRGAYAIVSHEWSPMVLRTEWGGAPSEMIIDETDNRPAREVVYNRVTELWYVVRAFVWGGQIKGFSLSAVKQFCSRPYYYTGQKIQISPKADCKKLLGRSPDDADAVAGIVEVARRHGAQGTLTPVAGSQSRSWDDIAKQANELFEAPEGEDAMGLSEVSLYA